MIHVQISVEFLPDELGPAARYWGVFLLPASFAISAGEAHAKLLGLVASTDYFELPQVRGCGLIPFNSSTIRQLIVRELK